MKPTPYNTGKVLIGRFYEPPRQNYMSTDAERLQSALLKPAPRYLDAHQQEIRMAVRDALLLIAGCAVLVAMLYAPSLFKLFTGA